MPDYIIPGAQAVTEWSSRVGGVIAGCGEASLLVIEAISSGHPPSIEGVTMLILMAIRNGWSNPGGVITPSGLAQLGQATGNPLQIGPGNQTLQTIDANLAKGIPTEIGISRAYVFGGSDRNVRGHYVTIVGKNSDTGQYIVADPNQPQATQGQFVRYSGAQIMSAAPFATLTPINFKNGGGGLSNPITDAIASAINNFNPVAQFFKAFNTNAADFAWRMALIAGGMTLIVVGMIVFFSHQEQQAGTVVIEQAGNAAKVAGAAAAA